MLLNPISGTIQIASALAGKLTDSIGKDATSKALLERFGPQCKSSWDLLVDVSAVAALETRAWLRHLWADLAERDRALLGERDGEALRAALLERITELRVQRQRPVSIEGQTIADIMAFVDRTMEEGPYPLIEYLVGDSLTGPRPKLPEADTGWDVGGRLAKLVQRGRAKLEEVKE